MTPAQLRAHATDLDREATALLAQATQIETEAGRAAPVANRLTYAATMCCYCGAGFAYDPFTPGDTSSPFKGPSRWECSAILTWAELPPDRQAQVKAERHTPALPFATYEVKSEKQPSVGGRTTRPVGCDKIA